MILKAIHNAIGASIPEAWLRVITQTYDFESNSQPPKELAPHYLGCESSRKPMILKAIHNWDPG